MSFTRLVGLLVVSLAALFTTACEPWHYLDDGYYYDDECIEYAYDEYIVCDTYCDYWGCYDSCYSTYDEYCVAYAQPDRYPNGTYDECYNDRDCRRGEYCDRYGECVRDVAPPVNSGATLCEPCERHDDCAEVGALCLVFGDDEQGHCGAPCGTSNDCDAGYECLRTDTVNQCFPQTRSCDPDGPSPVFECAVDSECASGETCDDGTCVTAGQSACATDGECATNEACVVGICRASCIEDAACDDGELCRGGVCATARPAECETRAQCGGRGFFCVEGTCRDGCDTDDDCPADLSCGERACELEAVECAADTDCGVDQECVDNGCFYPSSQP